MARFIGGPYDGQELPANPEVVKRIRLPDPDSSAGMLIDTLLKESTTGHGEWPHRYEVDETSQPPVYRFVEEFSE